MNERYSWFHTLDTTRQNALVDMRYQHGGEGFEKYTNMIRINS